MISRKNQNRKATANDTLLLKFSIIAVILAVLLIGCIYIPYARYKGECVEMDKIELHYDADGPFIMVDKSSGLVGVYNGITPVIHFRLSDTRNFNGPVMNVPTLVYGDPVEDKNTWWEEDHK